MAVLSLTILGIVSVRQIPKELLPHMTFSFIEVTTFYENYRNLSTPEQTERRVTLPLEDVLGSLPHIQEMESRSYSNRVDIEMEFDPEADMRFMAQQVRDKVNAVRTELPDDLGPIGIWMFNTEDVPVLAMAMRFKGGEDQPDSAVERKLTTHLTRIEGIAQVEVMRASQEERITVDVSEDALSSHGISMLQLLMAISDANVEEDLGTIIEDERFHHVRVASKLRSAEEIRELRIPGSPLMVDDVADVYWGIPKVKNLFRINGEDTWIIFVVKESGANIVQAATDARNVLMELENDPLFRGCEFFVFFDQSEAIISVLTALRNSGMFGALFALIILLLFLRRFGTTCIVGLTIPISIIATFNFMHLANITLNVASMAGMMFAVGMLVDNAVVVIESIHRAREEGLNKREASLKGSREVGMAITAATMTTVIVFLPVIFVLKSDFGEFTKQFGLTISFALLTSLALALTLIPLLGSQFMPKKLDKEQKTFRWARRRVEQVERIFRTHRVTLGVSLFLVCVAIGFHSIGKDLLVPANLPDRCPMLYRWTFLPFALRYCFEALRRFRDGLTVVMAVGIGGLALLLILSFNRFQDAYVNVLRWMLGHRGLSLLIAFVAVILSVTLGLTIEREHYPGLIESRVGVRVYFPNHYTYEEREAVMLRLEEMYLPRNDLWGVMGLMIRCTPSWGRINFFLKDETELEKTQKEIKAEIIDSLPRWPGIRFEVDREPGEARSGEEVGVILRGFDTTVLREISEEVKVRLKTVEGVEEVRVGEEEPEQELQVSVDREAAAANGVQDLRQLSLVINAALSGHRVGQMRTREGMADIFLRLREEDRKDIDSLKKLGIPNQQMQLVPLENVATFTVSKGPRRLERLNGRSFISVVGRTQRTGTQKLAQEIENSMAGLVLPEGYDWELGGRFEAVETEMSNIKLVMTFATFLIFLLLSSQFESVVHPFVIMFTFPFATIGVVWALFLTGTTINVVSGCGIIVLAGIVVNNAIVMVDYINGLRKRGYSRDEAILVGCHHRVRPVLMTALTTIIGLLPMALGSNDSRYAMYSAMGKSIEGGLISATLLTLLLIPVVYSLLDDVQKLPERIWPSRKRRIRNLDGDSEKEEGTRFR